MRILNILFCGVVLSVVPMIAAGQPSVSRGQQILSIGYEECLRRAQGAFSAEGWGNIGTSGNAVNAFKGIHASYIVCNPAPDAKMAVNVFVASTSNDSGVPGYERQRLQARMEGANPPPPATADSCWRWQFEMKTGRRDEAMLRLKPNGEASLAKWGITGRWRADGGRIIIDWGRGAGREDVVQGSASLLTGANFETNWIRGDRIACPN